MSAAPGQQQRERKAACYRSLMNFVAHSGQ